MDVEKTVVGNSVVVVVVDMVVDGGVIVVEVMNFFNFLDTVEVNHGAEVVVVVGGRVEVISVDENILLTPFIILDKMLVFCRGNPSKTSNSEFGPACVPST